MLEISSLILKAGGFPKENKTFHNPNSKNKSKQITLSSKKKKKTSFFSVWFWTMRENPLFQWETFGFC